MAPHSQKQEGDAPELSARPRIVGRIHAKAFTREDQRLLSQILRPLAGRAAASTARTLLQTHGNLPKLLSFCREQPSTDKICCHLATIDRVLRHAALGRLSAQPVLPSQAATYDYLMLEMANLPVEHVRVLFLDVKNRLIADEVMARGTIDCASFFPREILKRAFDLGAGSIMLAHNHPSGDPSPSKQDIAVTRQIAEAGRLLKIPLLDHLVLASSGWVSFRVAGYI